MKRIILVRHAKSSWDEPDWSDFERPLNKRGKKDAPIMAEMIKGKNIVPDLMISSTANRALTTAKVFRDAIAGEQTEFVEDLRIYENGTRFIISLLSKQDDKHNTIMLFGHNPDMTSVSSYFAGDYFTNVPTCGVVCVDFDTDKWEEINKINGKLVFFEYPKKHK